MQLEPIAELKGLFRAYFFERELMPLNLAIRFAWQSGLLTKEEAYPMLKTIHRVMAEEGYDMPELPPEDVL